MARTFSAREVREVLLELVHRLAERGDTARICVIDAIQLERGLDADWFNSHAQGLQPPVGGEEIWHEVFHDGEVVLYAANTDALLAMKLRAARGKDTPDIAIARVQHALNLPEIGQD